MKYEAVKVKITKENAHLITHTVAGLEVKFTAFDLHSTLFYFTYIGYDGIDSFDENGKSGDEDYPYDLDLTPIIQDKYPPCTWKKGDSVKLLVKDPERESGGGIIFNKGRIFIFEELGECVHKNAKFKTAEEAIIIPKLQIDYKVGDNVVIIVNPKEQFFILQGRKYFLHCPFKKMTACEIIKNEGDGDYFLRSLDDEQHENTINYQCFNLI
jgi:hypothetical protein